MLPKHIKNKIDGFLYALLSYRPDLDDSYLVQILWDYVYWEHPDFLSDEEMAAIVSEQLSLPMAYVLGIMNMSLVS